MNKMCRDHPERPLGLTVALDNQSKNSSGCEQCAALTTTTRWPPLLNRAPRGDKGQQLVVHIPASKHELQPIAVGILTQLRDVICPRSWALLDHAECPNLCICKCSNIWPLIMILSRRHGVARIANRLTSARADTCTLAPLTADAAQTIVHPVNARQMSSTPARLVRVSPHHDCNMA